MQATLYQIAARHRPREFAPTLLSDFTTDGGTSVDPGIIATDPQWSLYAFDLDQDRAIFVRLPHGTDLSTAPFIMTMQFQTAEQVLTLPLDALLPLSETLPQPANLVLLFSIGRSGTTLANHILNMVPGTFGLSEPRAFIPLVFARDTMAPDRAQAMITAATRFLFRPPQGTAPHTFAIKFHSQILCQAELFHRAFPQARFVFMYRDAHGWANSTSQFLQNLGEPLLIDHARLLGAWNMSTANAPLETLARYVDVGAPLSPHAPLLAAIWAESIAEYQHSLALGVPFLALRYNELNTDRLAATRALLGHCGLSTDHAEAALAAFDRDSQEGTAIGRGGNVIRLASADYALIDATLARHDPPLSSDIRL